MHAGVLTDACSALVVMDGMLIAFIFIPLSRFPFFHGLMRILTCPGALCNLFVKSTGISYLVKYEPLDSPTYASSSIRSVVIHVSHRHPIQVATEQFKGIPFKVKHRCTKIIQIFTRAY